MSWQSVTLQAGDSARFRMDPHGSVDWTGRGFLNRSLRRLYERGDLDLGFAAQTLTVKVVGVDGDDVRLLVNLSSAGWEGMAGGA